MPYLNSTIKIAFSLKPIYTGAMIAEHCESVVTIRANGFETRDDAMIDMALTSSKLSTPTQGYTNPTEAGKFGWTAVFECTRFRQNGECYGQCLKEMLERHKKDLELPDNASIEGNCINK